MDSTWTDLRGKPPTADHPLHKGALIVFGGLRSQAAAQQTHHEPETKSLRPAPDDAVVDGRVKQTREATIAEMIKENLHSPPALECILNYLARGWKQKNIYVGNLPAYKCAGLGGMAEFVLRYLICDDEMIILTLAYTGLLMDCRNQVIEPDYLKRIYPELERLSRALSAEEFEMMTELMDVVIVALHKQPSGEVQ